ncbi:hypothetical protein LXL04_016917 [Taraxacum kok-saghyz]
MEVDKIWLLESISKMQALKELKAEPPTSPYELNMKRGMLFVEMNCTYVALYIGINLGCKLTDKDTFADDESLIGISGTVAVFGGNTVITSLSFITNKMTHGPYGTIRGTSFSLTVTKGRFSGFHGNYGDYLDSFGVILHPY